MTTRWASSPASVGGRYSPPLRVAPPRNNTHVPGVRVAALTRPGLRQAVAGVLPPALSSPVGETYRVVWHPGTAAPADALAWAAIGAASTNAVPTAPAR